ncbi:beta-1,4-galactosyltransferase 1-like [Rhopilema esculentum]|uniref:beta-1,4-galactosyltransferase 1-like n=1 Tax=Rhopilema esculentum TaxID=499914 RepID=UPI0031D9626A
MNALKAIAAAIVLLSTATVFNTFLVNRESRDKNVFSTEYIGRGSVLQFPLMSERVKQPCCKWDEDILGRLKVDLSDVDLNELAKKNGFLEVKFGGHWKPSECKPRRKVAIIIPFRNREKHLAILLRYLHPILQKQKLEYRIFVVEQIDDKPFNKGKMMNVGFQHSQKYNDFDCFVFHDVDMIPEDDRNDYGCPSSVRHMAPAVDKFNYKLFSPYLFGGVTSFNKDKFVKVNGFPNRYYGWGAEDDDMFHRVRTRRLRFLRPAMEFGRYTMIKHQESEKNAHAKKLLEKVEKYIDKDGLKSLRYTVVATRNMTLYTKIGVDSQMTEEEKKLTTAKGKN